MNFAEALQIWRPLGMLKDGSHISFEALTAIHYTHRLAAYVVVLALASLWWHCAMLRTGKQRRLLGFFAVLQVLTGLSNVVLDWPLVAAVLHTGGAAALVTIVVWSLAVTRANAVAAPTLKWRAAQPEA
jgi:cytochrome c oxidase assembly protein subunit 15